MEHTLRDRERGGRGISNGIATKTERKRDKGTDCEKKKLCRERTKELKEQRTFSLSSPLQRPLRSRDSSTAPLRQLPTQTLSTPSMSTTPQEISRFYLSDRGISICLSSRTTRASGKISTKQIQIWRQFLSRPFRLSRLRPS